MDIRKKFMPLWVIAALCLGLIILLMLPMKPAPDAVPGSVPISLPEDKEDDAMAEYDFSVFSNVEITGVKLTDFDQEQLSVLYQQARYCQAMTEPDTATMREMISEDMVFTHMSGRQQSREEYLVDIEKGRLRYFTIGIEKPVVNVDGDLASVTFTSVLNANAYGARGTYRMSGTHWYERQNGDWIAVNNPNA